MQPTPPANNPQAISHSVLLGLRGEGWTLVSVRDEAGEVFVPDEQNPRPLLLLEYQRGNVRVLVRCITVHLLPRSTQ